MVMPRFRNHPKDPDADESTQSIPFSLEFQSLQKRIQRPLYDNPLASVIVRFV